MIRGLYAISPIRYDDMVGSSPSRRTRMVTDSRELRQVDGGLAGGVAATDDDDVVALHLAGGGHRAAVEDAQADERLDRGDAELAVGDAGRDHDRAGAHVAAVGAQHERLTVGARLERGHRPPGEEAGAEADRLVAGPLGQPHPGDARGGSRGSCGSSTTCRPGRRPPPTPAPPWSGPPTRRTPRPRARRDRRRRRRRRPRHPARCRWGCRRRAARRHARWWARRSRGRRPRPAGRSGVPPARAITSRPCSLSGG